MNAEKLARIARMTAKKTYYAFYGGRKATIEACNTLEAQRKAAGIFKAKKTYDISVILEGQKPDCFY